MLSDSCLLPKSLSVITCRLLGSLFNLCFTIYALCLLFNCLTSGSAKKWLTLYLINSVLRRVLKFNLILASIVYRLINAALIGFLYKIICYFKIEILFKRYSIATLRVKGLLNIFLFNVATTLVIDTT